MKRCAQLSIHQGWKKHKRKYRDCINNSQTHNSWEEEVAVERKMGSCSDEAKQHVVMLPFLAQGHLIPFLSFANKLQKRTNFTITIATTPLNLQYLKKTISQNPNYNINLHEINFTGESAMSLPPTMENTESLSLDQFIHLFHASETLDRPTKELVLKITEEDGRPPLCIISDVFYGWACDVAKECNTTNITFNTGGAYGSTAYNSLWKNLPQRNLDDNGEFCVPGFPESSKFHVSQIHRFFRVADGNDSWSKFFRRQLSRTTGVSGWLCNTVEEVEVQGLEILRNYLKLPVWSIGPLFPEVFSQRSPKDGKGSSASRAGKEYGTSPEEILNWLDFQEERSVLFVSFGSQNSISPIQMMELAMGLEQSATPFIWVIRPPVGFPLRGEFRSEWLPEGFEQRIVRSKIGLIVHQWAPQLEILAHKSTGAFLSHCGWNSVMESLSQGLPIIGWPLAAEQSFNSKMLEEEMGVNMELARGIEGKVEAKEVKRIIQTVMNHDDKGGDMKKKAAIVAEQIKAAVEEGDDGHKGSSIRALDEFVDFIVSKRQ